MGFRDMNLYTTLYDEAGVTAIPENDTLGAVTQLVVKALTGQAAPYMEIYELVKDLCRLLGIDVIE